MLVRMLGYPTALAGMLCAGVAGAQQIVHFPH